MKNKLTQKQQKVLSFLQETVENNGYPPSLSEICSHLGIAAPKNARKHLDALERKGFIKREGRRSRAISLMQRAERPYGGVGRAIQAGSRTAPVPIIGRVRAGAPRLAVEDIEGYMRLDTDYFKHDGAFILRVDGDSMIGAGIMHGDHIVVAPASSAQSGDIVVAMLNDEATVKRLIVKDGAVTLKPENRLMKPIAVSESSAFSIIGRVMHVMRNL